MKFNKHFVITERLAITVYGIQLNLTAPQYRYKQMKPFPFKSIVIGVPGPPGRAGRRPTAVWPSL